MRKLVLWIAATLAAMAGTVATAGTSPDINTKAAVYIEGEINGNILRRVDKLVKESSEHPLDELQLVINSPGGNVTPGMVFIDALELLKIRGTKITCFVPLLAASMAFQILAHCDTRYALPGALLLWHPVRVMVFMAALAPADTSALDEELQRIEKRLLEDLYPKMGGLDKQLFLHHYKAETLHVAPELNEMIGSEWITIVDDMPGLSRLLPMRDERDEEVEESATTREWIFVYRQPRMENRGQ